jgi:transposase
MLAVPEPRRNPSTRHPFRDPPWSDDHPAWQRIDATLPADHHARWLLRVVARLDLAALRRSYAGCGSLAYPVELLLAFVLFLYAKGILSPAEWARRACSDDQSKWLLRGLQPSRSQLYTFRDRTEPYLDDWHKQLLAWALAEGIPSASSGSLDGSFVAALASRHQLHSGRRLDRRLGLLRWLVWLDASGHADLATRLQDLPELVLTAAVLWLELPSLGVAASGLEQTLQHLLAALELLSPEGDRPSSPRLPAWVPTSVAGRRRVLRRYEDARGRLTQRLQPYQRKKKLSKKDRETMKRLKVSLTDPEAALGWDKAGTYRPLDNVPLVQATDAPLTLAWDVLARNNDDGLLKPMMEKTHQQVGRHLREVLVDGAFVSVGEAVWCEREGITVYAPPGKAAAAKAEADPAAGQQGPAPKEKKLPKETFRYDGTEKVYYCPQGKRLEEVARTTLKRPNGIELPMIVHRASGQDCQGCPQQRRCTSNPQKGRVVKRYEGEEALERLQQRMAEPASGEVDKLRCRSVELGYADIKQHRGLRVFRCFGRKRARAQAGLVILASNGLKILQALQRRQHTEPHPAPPEKLPA